MSSDKNPWSDVVRTRNHLNTAKNSLGDAIGEVMADEIPVTHEQARQRQAAVERHIRDAEREIDRAKRRIGMDTDDPDPAPNAGGGD